MESSTKKTSVYYPHIDGLRAISVILVIFFHAGFSGFSGGFVGVDVFFVISGFLITGILKTQIESGTFTLRHFYFRRFKRLYPALAVVVAITIAVGLFLQSTGGLMETAISGFHAIAAISNYHFALLTGYWDHASHTKTLLHTWSLGVEEQFYLLWPACLLVLMQKLGLRRTKNILIAFFFISLAFTIWFTGFDRTYSFYWFPARIYEFLIGCILALYWAQVQTTKAGISNIISVIGLACILGSGILMSSQIAFPGSLAVLPCLGAAFVIVSPNSFFNRKILSHRLSIWIGKLSYSLYLVHWPIFVFYKYHNGVNIADDIAIYLICTAFIIAVLLHYLIERPLRYGRLGKLQFDTRPTIIVTGCAILWVGFWAGWLYLKQYNPLAKDIEWSRMNGASTYNAFSERSRTWFEECAVQKDCQKLLPGRPNLLVIGDSFAIDGYNALKAGFPNERIVLWSLNGCPPFKNLSKIRYFMRTREDLRIECKEHRKTLWAMLEAWESKLTVVLSVRLSRVRLREVKALTRTLTAAGHTVVVFGVGPAYKKGFKFALRQANSFSDFKQRAVGTLRRSIFELNKNARLISTEEGAIYIDKLDFFCSRKPMKCRLITNDGKSLVLIDQLHLSTSAANEWGISPNFKESLQGIISKP